MTEEFVILNEEGLAAFREWLKGGAKGEAPHGLLGDFLTSSKFGEVARPDRSGFADKMDFGKYLTDLLHGVDPARFYASREFWATLSLIWFDELRLVNKGKGAGTVDRYIPSDDARLFYRHLVRTTWLAYRNHGENSRFMLTGTRETARPLSQHGEVLEQITGRQRIFGSKPVVKAANRLFINPKTGRPGAGTTGEGSGTARRFGKVLRQLDLTLDPETMTTEELIASLPREFDRWKPADESAAG